MSDVTGSVSVEVVPSLQGWNEKVRAAVLPGADGIGREYGEALSAGMDEGLRDPSITPHVHDEEARAEIDDLRLKVAELSHDKANVDVTVNNASGVRGWLTSLIAGAVAIAPAFVVAGVGIGAFAALAAPDLKKVAAYEAELGKNATLAAQKYNALTATQKDMVAGITGLKSEFHALSAAIQPEVLDVFNAALHQADLILREIAPVAKAGGQALTTLINDVGGAFTGSSGQQFFQFVAKNLEPDVAEIGETVSALIRTFFSLVEALQPVSLGLLNVVTAVANAASWLSRVAPPLDDVIVLAIALYKPLKALNDLHLAASFENLASAVTGVAVASDAKGLKFTWLSGAVSGTRDLASAAIAAAGAQKVAAASALETGAGVRVFAVDAAGAAVAMDDLSIAEKAAAVGMAALDAVNPLVWVAAAAAAIGGAFVLANKLATDSVNQQADALQRADGAYGTNLAGMEKYLAGLKRTASAVHDVNDSTTEGLGDTNPFSWLFRDSQDSAIDKRVAAASAQVRNFTAGLGLAERQGHLTQAQVLALGADLGIQGKAWKSSAKSSHDAAEQIISYSQAMQVASQGTGALNSNLLIMKWSADQQKSAVAALASAWSSYITSLTGTQSSFDSYALGMAGLSKDAAAAGATFGGLNKASLTLNQTFQSQLDSLQAVSGSLRTSGVSAKTFDSGIRGGLDTMVRFAGGSKVATAELVAFARQAGFKGPDSLRALTGWLGNTAGGARKLQDAMDKAAISEAGMSQESKQLGRDLESDVSNMMAVAGLSTAHAQQAIDKYTKALQDNRSTTGQLHADQQNLVSVLEKAGLTASEARREADALGRAYGQDGTSAYTAAGRIAGIRAAIDGVTSRSAAAALEIQQLRNEIALLHGKTIDILVNVNGGGASIPTSRLVAGGLPSAAGGAVVPGYAPGHDTRTWRLSPGEGVAVPELVQAIGPDRFMALNRQFSGGRKSTGSALSGGGITDTASFGFPQDVFNISVGPIGGGGSGAGPGIRDLDRVLHGELRPHSSIARMDADGKALSAAFEKAFKDTAAQIKDETKRALKDIREFYSGPAATQLEHTIRSQGTALEHLATASVNLASKIANIKAYAAQETQSLQGFSDISNITGKVNPLTGATEPVTGQEIRSGLGKMLGQLHQFLAVIGKLKAAGVDRVLIAQVIALGPVDGITYGEAILSGGKKLIAELNREEKFIGDDEVKIGQRAADIQFGQPLAKGFLHGLRAQRRELEEEMKRLGDVLAREARRALRGTTVSGHGGGASAAAVSSAALASASTVGGTTAAAHAFTRSDVSEIRASLRATSAREATLATRAQMTRVISLLESAPKATGTATGHAVASELNGVAKNAAAAARARTR